MTILAALLFAATHNGCPVTRLVYYPPMVIEACGQVWSCKAQASYSRGVLTVPNCSADRVFSSSFQ